MGEPEISFILGKNRRPHPEPDDIWSLRSSAYAARTYSRQHLTTNYTPADSRSIEKSCKRAGHSARSLAVLRTETCPANICVP